ncbi:glycosyltransferase family 39 protein [Halorarum halophilum]|uniref:Glycosyltransferase family 39 protein n=1 Tax=Halorarum halophilum TaxID=2743090 RepID=A0A7D5GCV5_9EURY|nr:glycosyltransferase family 39 protein [Halobaculum halophilum]QLG26168.1 glycosyltransferase family 39 protein [Halobaculum halophilum]
MIDSLAWAVRRRLHSVTRTARRGVTRADAVALLLTVAAAVVAVLVATRLFPYHTPNHDEAVYLQQAAMLLDGRLFLDPPVAESFRPWFFVRAEDGSLYSKYAPVPAAMFAVGTLLGGPRLALGGIAAAVVVLTHLTVREAFDARHGAVAAGFLLASPLFVVQSGVFLPYAATTVWNLLFAFAYLRADRTGSIPWAAVAGVAVGVAFFSRPYTATLFAAPFVAHAVWRIGNWGAVGSLGSHASAVADGVDRDALDRNFVTAVLGCAGVTGALVYNWGLTGDPLVFPYAAFAPADGLGFGRREILGYEVVYTPGLAIEANARVLAALLSDWVAGGPVGSLLAAVGLGLVAARAAGQGGADSRRLALAGLALSIPLGNVLFWGNLNVLGTLETPGDGLISLLGPYYHFDVLVPAAAFAAHALIVGGGRLTALVRGRVPSERRSAALLAAVAVVSAATFAVPAATAMGEPVERNAAVTEAYAEAYEPFEERSFDDALVFLPTPYGDWLNHPFQPLRNDPGYDGDAVYALRENQFAVVDAFPDRSLYRYTYRGTWAPSAGATVEPRLQRVRHVSGDGVRMDAAVGIPTDAQSVSVRLDSANGSALFAANGTPDSLPLSLIVADGRATLDGPVSPVGDDTSVPVRGRETLELEVYVSTGGTAAFSYWLDVPVLVEGDGARALTPYAEVCTTPRLCGGEAAYVPRTAGEGVSADLELTTANGSAPDGLASNG